MWWILKLALVTLAIEVITAVPVTDDPLKKLNLDRQSACSLIFNVATTPEGQQTVTSIKMPSVQPILSDEETMMMRDICNLILAVKPTVTVGAGSSTDSSQQQTSLEDNNDDMVQPMYELQLTAWPSEIDNITDAVQEFAGTTDYEEQDIIFPEEEAVMAQAAASNQPAVIPLYEDQLVIFPEMGYEAEEEVDAENEADETLGTSVQVVENYHTVHPNGTTEYKLALSNGLVNYKKIYNKIVDGEVITVQEGYDSIPVPGKPDEYQTQFYIADENGNNVYSVEHSHRKPELPAFLSYSGSRKALRQLEMYAK